MTVNAAQWKGVHGEPPMVRTPAQSPHGMFAYGMVDTPQGPKPVERGDWIVVDEAGNVVPWRPEHFAQVFEPSSPDNDAQPRAAASDEAPRADSASIFS